MRRQLALTLACSLFALAACNQNSSQNQTPAEAASAAVAAARELRPEPGKYRITTKITNVSIPGMPAAMADQAKKMFSQTGHSSEFCLTAADAQMGYEEMVKRAAEGKCSYDRFSAEGGKLDAAMTCETGKGMSTKATMTGTFSPTGSNMAMTSEGSIPDLPGGKMKMDMTVVTERLGPCG